MSVMVQIRNVPDEVHKELRLRAVRAGLTLSDFLLREVVRVAERPSLDDVLKRVATRKPLLPKVDSAALLRRERTSR